MKILVAPNTLRGSLDAVEAARAIGEGLRRVMPAVELRVVPIADGGDGTAAIVAHACGGQLLEAEALDPLGRRTCARWACLPDATAVIDVAAASGLSLLRPAEYCPLDASSYGTGQLVRAALDHGCRGIVVGLGGSATIDAGAGLLEALGARFLTRRGERIARGGRGLQHLERIELDALDPRLGDTSVLVACDVDHPLLGPAGAARVFGPQKGATPEMVIELELGLERLAEVVQAQTGREVRSLRHTGAAGGIGASLYGLLGAKLIRGIDWVLEQTGFATRIEGCDLVITSEGRLDEQTLGHKGPFGVAEAARAHGVPVIVLAGGIDDRVTAEPDRFAAFDAMLGLCRRPVSLDEAMQQARPWLAAAAEQAARLMLLGASWARGTNRVPRDP